MQQDYLQVMAVLHSRCVWWSDGWPSMAKPLSSIGPNVQTVFIPQHGFMSFH